MTPPAAALLGRPTAWALAAVVLAAGGVTTGCGSGPAETTCGEVRAMSVAERVDLLGEIADELAGDQPEDLSEASREEEQQRAEVLLETCEPEDDDTRLADLGSV